MPRIPIVSDFRIFADAGRELALLHLNYETIPRFPLAETVTGPMDTPARELYRVEKMAFVDKDDKSAIRYNTRVTVSGIPPEAHGYMLGARSAIAWIIERYRVGKDVDSGIVNDPNDWSDDPRYIIDLLGRIVTVSLETMKIVEALPDLDILELSHLN
jgi:predicted helicase